VSLVEQRALVTILYHVVLVYYGMKWLACGWTWIYFVFVYATCICITKYGSGWDGLELARHDPDWNPPRDELLQEKKKTT
jgi:hypothetical protein